MTADKRKEVKSDDQSDDSLDSSCCGCCDFKRSTSTRLYYTLFLLVTTVICFIVLAPKTKEKLYATPHLCSELLNSRTCANLVGYSAVYRLCFAIASFFFVSSLLFVQVKYVNDLRARIHNGFWYFKFMAFVGKYNFTRHAFWFSDLVDLWVIKI